MIGIGSDHRGYNLKNEIKKYFDEVGIEYKDYGTDSTEITHYPIIAADLSRGIQDKECDRGILICGSGIGMSIAANKFKGIRCALCTNEEAAKLAKAHDNANVIALPADTILSDEAIRAVRIWLATEFLNGRYLERQKMIKEIEKDNMK